MKYSKDRKLQNSGTPPYKVWTDDYNSETIKIYRQTVYTIAHPFPFVFNAHETMIKVLSL
jgi:hypothetical protein